MPLISWFFATNRKTATTTAKKDVILTLNNYPLQSPKTAHVNYCVVLWNETISFFLLLIIHIYI